MAAFGSDAQVVGKSTIDHVSSRNSLPTHERVARSAVSTGATCLGRIRGYDPIAGFESPDERSDFHCRAAELMSEHHRRPTRPFPINDMNISATNACVA